MYIHVVIYSCRKCFLQTNLGVKWKELILNGTFIILSQNILCIRFKNKSCKLNEVSSLSQCSDSHLLCVQSVDLESSGPHYNMCS